jgi:2-hydroxychromene-2-carboxylate isomerase
VPSFIVDGELFWGREHLPDIRDMLAAPPAAKAS